MSLPESGMITASNPLTINILGVTGSVGQCAADVIATHSGRFDVQYVSAHNNGLALARAAIRLGAKAAILSGENVREFEILKADLAGTKIRAHFGFKALLDLCEQPVDVTVAAIVGIAGLRPAMAAVKASKAVAIANKEPLVAAGALLKKLAAIHNTKILPIDSEHNAVFQVFEDRNRAAIKRIILTASGGPFLRRSVNEMRHVTPEQAIAHPNWSMGPKISIDSATMMNKALEVIEAHVLFDMPPEKIDVLIHPQSVVHSMVEYEDGSVLSQMGAADMRTPLAAVLAWPDRLKTPGKTLDIKALGTLSFEPPDLNQFPALPLAYNCIREGLHACIALNAANEVAVASFLDGRIGFLDILPGVDHVIQDLNFSVPETIEDVEAVDQFARQKAAEFISGAQSVRRVVYQ